MIVDEDRVTAELDVRQAHAVMDGVFVVKPSGEPRERLQFAIGSADNWRTTRVPIRFPAGAFQPVAQRRQGT